MKPSSKLWHSKHAGTILNIALLLVVTILLVFIISLVRIKLLLNAQNMGDALTHSYAIEEENNILALQRYTMLAGEYLDEFLEQGSDSEEIATWLSSYFDKLASVIGEGVVDPYAVINGRIVAANPWEGDSDYPYQDSMWYLQALEADGDVVCSDVYEDAITNRRVLTISKMLKSSGDVFAMDVYIQNTELHSDPATLPESSSLYICDESGTLIYSVVNAKVTDEQLQTYADFLLTGYVDGSLLGYDATFDDYNGITKSAYYYRMDNGWTVILTLPVNSILMGERNMVFYVVAVVAGFIFAALVFMTIRDFAQNRKMNRSAGTIQMLGESFYAVFRINFKDGTYEGIKIYEDLQNVLTPNGNYSEVVNAMQTVVKPETFDKFAHSFSLESIRERVKQGISDYGGSYERRFGDTYRWVNVRTIYMPDIAPDEVILCFRDVDGEKRRELQQHRILQNALESAQNSVKARSEFFSRMSHDMRTPLNAVIGCCELAQKNYEAGNYAKLEDYLNKIAFSSKQLLDLINDILELSRMEAGKNALTEKSFDLKELIQNAADVFATLAEKDNKKFELQIHFQKSKVIGDPQKILQIINNLLSNSFKYSNEGALIALKARQFGDHKVQKYQIIVEDTGIGMSADFLNRLFEPYSRETMFAEQSKLGAGLGMSIVQNLVHQMDGEISVKSELHKGTCFTVTIPLKCSDDAHQEPEKEQPTQKSFTWTGKRILIAEDNELNMEILQEILQELGVVVLPAMNGEEAVRVFSESEPFSIDAILMDMQMPVMDGCQASIAIRALERPDAQKVPIIAVTANAFTEDIDKTSQAGMNDHISKPVDVRLLMQILGKLIQQ